MFKYILKYFLQILFTIVITIILFLYKKIILYKIKIGGINTNKLYYTEIKDCRVINI